jgi:hypothetical protein
VLRESGQVGRCQEAKKRTPQAKWTFAKTQPSVQHTEANAIKCTESNGRVDECRVCHNYDAITEVKLKCLHLPVTATTSASASTAGPTTTTTTRLGSHTLTQAI